MSAERIRILEERNGELAKEILLNETAIYETEKELAGIDDDLLSHPRMQRYIAELKSLITQILSKSEVYKREIYENELELLN